MNQRITPTMSFSASFVNSRRWNWRNPGRTFLYLSIFLSGLLLFSGTANGQTITNVSLVSPTGSTTFCRANQLVHITGTSLPSTPASYSFVLSSNTGVFSPGTTLSVVRASSASATDVYIVVTIPTSGIAAGTGYKLAVSGPATYTSAAFAIGTTGAPTFAAKFNPADYQLCPGGAVSLTVTSAVAATTYHVADETGTVIGSSQTGATSLAFPVSATGTYQAFASTSVCSGLLAGSPATATVNPYSSVAPTGITSSVPTISATSLSICDGTNATLTTTAPCPTGSTAKWYRRTTGPVNNTVTSNTLSLSTLSGGNVGTVYSYSVTCNAAGCGDSSPFAFTVTVYQPAAPTVLPKSNTVCAGSPVSLTANSANALSPTYVWIDNGSTTTITDKVRVITTGPTAATTVYKVIVTDARGCTNITTNAASATIVTNALPTASIAPAAPTICNGQSATLTVTTDNGTTFAWNDASLAGATPVASPTATTTYNLTVTDANTCSNTATVTVTVVPALTATIAATPSQTICIGQTVSLSATGGTDFVWNTGETAATISVAPTSTTAYNVTVTSGICSATATIDITVNTLPTVSIAESPTICAGQSTTLTPSGGTSYTWNTAATDNPYVVTPASTTNYTVTATDANGCSNTASTSVTVNNLPTASIAPAAPTICNGQSATLTVTTDNGTTFAWNDASLAGATPVASPTATTTYNLTVTDANTCSNTATVTVTVVPALTATIAGNLTICSGKTTTLTASGGTTYTWNTGANTAAITVSPTSTTPYTVTAISGICSSTATVTVTVETSPTVTVSPSTTTIDSAETTTFTASGATTYLWSNTEITAAISASNAIAGTYPYSVTGTTGNCKAVATATLTVTAVCPIQPSATNFRPSAVLGGSSCSVQLTATASGLRFVITGPGGYVFSTVYRNAGTYSITANSVKLPGTYTLWVYGTNGCTTAVYTTTVAGTACP